LKVELSSSHPSAHAAPPTVSAVRPIQLPPDVLATVDYTYDNVGNRLSAISSQQSAASNFAYTYDPLSQLDTVTEPTQGNWNYDYDAVGNRTQVIDPTGTTSYSPNNLNQYATVGSTTYQYDPNGNLTNDGTWTHTYDSENRLVSSSAVGSSGTYTYDAFGRRISKTVNGQTTKFTWDGDQLLEELDGAGNQTAEYVYGPGIDEPLRMERGTTKTYYHPDGLGSVSQLTDKTGKVVEQYTYDAYGKPTITDATGTPLTQSAYGNRYLFTGREYDQETGLYFYRARYYNPSIGRFLSRDPLTWGPDDPRVLRSLQRAPLSKAPIVVGILASYGFDLNKNLAKILFVPLGFNAVTLEQVIEARQYGTRHLPSFGLDDPQLLQLYSYVGNNPLNFIDPFGYDKIQQKLVFEAAFGIGATLVGGVVYIAGFPVLGTAIAVGAVILSGVKIGMEGYMVIQEYQAKQDALLNQLFNQIPGG